MKLTNIKLPTNKKFGYFFSGVFLLASIYFFYLKSDNVGYIFSSLTIIFIVVTFLKAELLLPLNKLWMRFGLLLGMIISPIVLGVIFFGIFTPYGFVMRIMGRDEMNLKIFLKKSYWIIRSKNSKQTNFKNQF
tara:strand:- start:202 stop:600 length:399 start_codon:yes stop_codon:yes gene_type:complete